jgi:hypothetical protein
MPTKNGIIFLKKLKFHQMIFMSELDDIIPLNIGGTMRYAKLISVMIINLIPFLLHAQTPSTPGVNNSLGPINAGINNSLSPINAIVRTGPTQLDTEDIKVTTIGKCKVRTPKGEIVLNYKDSPCERLYGQMRVVQNSNGNTTDPSTTSINANSAEAAANTIATEIGTMD